MVKLSTEVVDELNDGVNVALPLSMDLLAAQSEWTTYIQGTLIHLVWTLMYVIHSNKYWVTKIALG